MTILNLPVLEPWKSSIYILLFLFVFSWKAKVQFKKFYYFLCRYNSYDIKFILLKCTTQLFLVLRYTIILVNEVVVILGELSL